MTINALQMLVLFQIEFTVILSYLFQHVFISFYFYRAIGCFRNIFYSFISNSFNYSTEQYWRSNAGQISKTKLERQNITTPKHRRYG